MDTTNEGPTISFVASEEHDEAAVYASRPALDAVVRMFTGRVRFEEREVQEADGAHERCLSVPANGVIAAYRLLTEGGFPVQLVRVAAGECECAEHRAS